MRISPDREVFFRVSLELSTRRSDEQLKIEELEETFVRGKIVRNKFMNFHGGISVYGGNGVLISENTLIKSSYIAIIASGKNIDILNNRILYPGNGTTGDGITIYETMLDSTISGNLIYAGSCYGIWILANYTSGIIIEGNTILNGITSAIYMSSKTLGGDGIKGVLVKDNVMTGNAGFAVAIENGQNITLSNNHFEGNATGFPAQLFVSRVAKNIVVVGNTSSKKLTPQWAKDMALYRHHMYEDNDVFSPVLDIEKVQR